MLVDFDNDCKHRSNIKTGQTHMVKNKLKKSSTDWGCKHIFILPRGISRAKEHGLITKIHNTR